MYETSSAVSFNPVTAMETMIGQLQESNYLTAFKPLPIGILVLLVQFLPLHAQCRLINSDVYENSSAVSFNPVPAMATMIGV